MSATICVSFPMMIYTSLNSSMSKYEILGVIIEFLAE